MVQGEFINGDFLIDAGNVSLSAGRAVFGAWWHVLTTVSVYAIRSTFIAHLTAQLVPQTQTKNTTSLWLTSPATNLQEVFALRRILFQNYTREKLPFIFTSLTCILALILTAASTAMANATVVSNVVVRQRMVQGRLAYDNWVDLVPDAVVNLTTRVHALDNANAPLEVLLDFIPEDNSDWVYVAHEWNNSWNTQCAYHLYSAVDLVMLPSDLSDLSFQIVVPSLGEWLPEWASANETGQGAQFMENVVSTTNSSSLVDILALYVFSNPPDDPSSQQYNWSSVNITLANFLAHNIQFDSSGNVTQTDFQTDVHVAECTFTTSQPDNQDKSRANGIADDIAISLVSIVGVQFQALTSFTPPTAQDMVRYLQAYMSVKDTLTAHPVQRLLSVSRPVVQIRLSVLLVTLSIFFCVFGTALRAHLNVPLGPYGRKIRLPSTMLDWMVQAARERPEVAGEMSMDTTASFIERHQDLVYTTLLTHEGHRISRITRNGSPPLRSEYELDL